LEPSRLRRSKDLTARSRRAISPIAIRAPVASHVEQKNIEQWTVAHLAIDAPGIGERLPHWHKFKKRTPPARR